MSPAALRRGALPAATPASPDENHPIAMYLSPTENHLRPETVTCGQVLTVTLSTYDILLSRDEI